MELLHKTVHNSQVCELRKKLTSALQNCKQHGSDIRELEAARNLAIEQRRGLESQLANLQSEIYPDIIGYCVSLILCNIFLIHFLGRAGGRVGIQAKCRCSEKMSMFFYRN